ncbi:MAG: acyl-CoA dehydrogenase family protein [Candidatus Thorarchaeota archaeon]|nr:MAG: acyl-CoA dehydrogenase [Candidatus Thorarchaeota archaeon]RLI59779.1 MAG: acyl-CoA dehydrogenase [Candidatus Thorarchaeota archaeon]
MTDYLSTALWTEDEIEFRKEVRAFCDKEIVPIADEIDRGPYPRELLRKIGKAGYMGVHHTKSVGGSERGLSYEVIVAEEISAANAGLDMARMASTTLYGMPIAKFGTEEQKKKYLKPVVAGDLIGCIGITEPDVGSDTAGMKTRAEKDGDEWVLNGEKRFITNGSQADYMCAFAITDPSVKSKQGMSAFIVDTKSDGFSVVQDHELMGMKSARVSWLKLDNVRVKPGMVLGEIGQGFRILMDELDSERTAIAGEAIGYGRTPYEIAVKYSTEREQFGRPIRTFEGVSFKIADMAMKLEAGRALTLLAARMYDRGEKITKEAAIAKLYTTEAAISITNDALQVLGGTGYTTEYPIERFLRDARLMTIGGGTAEILRFIIQREVFKQFFPR